MDLKKASAILDKSAFFHAAKMFNHWPVKTGVIIPASNAELRRHADLIRLAETALTHFILDRKKGKNHG